MRVVVGASLVAALVVALVTPTSDVEPAVFGPLATPTRDAASSSEASGGIAARTGASEVPVETVAGSAEAGPSAAGARTGGSGSGDGGSGTGGSGTGEGGGSNSNVEDLVSAGSSTSGDQQDDVSTDLRTPGGAGDSCLVRVRGSVGSAPGDVSPGGVLGTTTADLEAFATAFNRIRMEQCLDPVPLANFRFDPCIEARLFWIAEDPSTDPLSAWGHDGTKRSDGVPAVGCDANLAGGRGNTGATVAQKWWDSSSHRKTLYRPTYSGSMSSVVICFAIVRGGLPYDGADYARAGARWGGC